MRKYIPIFILCSMILFLTLGEIDFVFADQITINQDYPMKAHGMTIIYECDKNPECNPPPNVTLSGGEGDCTYVLNLKEDLPDKQIYVTNFIKPVGQACSNNRYQVDLSKEPQIIASYNGVSSEPTNVVVNELLDFSDLLNAGYGNLYEIGLNLNCDDFGNDTDNDGLCNDWELGTAGLKITDTTSGVSYTLECNGSSYDDDPLGMGVCPDPNIPDIYYEIDSMKGHRPDEFALKKVVSSFLATPYKVGETVTGIHPHFQISDGNLPHVTSLPMPGGGILAGYDALKVVWFGTDSTEERGYNNPTPENYWNKDGTDPKRDLKSQAFHYIIMGHNTYNPSTPEVINDITGMAELPGNDALLTLGSWDFKVGNEDHQAGTLMHEIGHNIDLNHGGSDSVNCKPNYLSVMSYSRQFPDLIPGITPAFSHDRLDTFNVGETWRDLPSGNETVYGKNNGANYAMITGPDGEVPSNEQDPNKINEVDCAGGDVVFEGSSDLDTINMLDRTFGTFDEGRGSLEGQGIEAANAVFGDGAGDWAAAKLREKGLDRFIPLPYDYKPCNVEFSGTVGIGSNLSGDRTCIDEGLSYHSVVDIRGPLLKGVTEGGIQQYARYIDPSCMTTFTTILTNGASDIDNGRFLPQNVMEEEDTTDDVAISIRDAIDELNSETCIPDDEKREEIISYLESELNTVLRAVPEFETMALIILSISIISVIVMTNKSKLSLAKINS